MFILINNKNRDVCYDQYKLLINQIEQSVEHVYVVSK